MSTLPEPEIDTVITPKDTSVDDDVRSALAEVKGRAEAPAETPEVETAPESVRTRDEQGKFAKAEAVKAAETKAPLIKASEIKQPDVKPAGPKPPEGWTATAKAKFPTLDPEVQAEIMRRETESHQKITTQDQDRDFGKKIRELASPYTAIIQAEGGDHAKAFQDYLNTAYILRTGSPQMKTQALQKIAQMFNVPLTLQAQPGQQAPAALPQADVRSLVQAEISQWRQSQDQAALKSEIETFSVDPGHEHFETVKPVMAALLQSGQAQDLQDAYDQAVWANPTIRSTLTATQTASAEEKRLTEAKAKTDAAKRAAVSVTGGPGGARVSPGNGVDRSLEDEIRANYRTAQGRV